MVSEDGILMQLEGREGQIKWRLLASRSSPGETSCTISDKLSHKSHVYDGWLSHLVIDRHIELCPSRADCSAFRIRRRGNDGAA
jgi:hypothetical protein